LTILLGGITYHAMKVEYPEFIHSKGTVFLFGV